MSLKYSKLGTLEEISTQNGPFNTYSNSMSSSVANEIDLNFKYCIGLKQIFNINLGIGMIRKFTFFVHIFDIHPCVFSQISSKRGPWM